ncbi:MAG TPA: DNA-3-methyladenine glycosylase I [Verrucomicrobiae bacterium]|jgi:DNA-3-methyladenine glycosylase I|nr:DNA-3-methyladenine glycosylase I [Verrucomicrobiae bacterium]
MLPERPDDSVPTIPEIVHPKGNDDYLAVISRAVFQTGLSWKQIAQHWGAYLRAFRNFDCAAVAAFGDLEIERVLMEPGVLRSPRKVAATVKNARAILDLDRQHGGFAAYLRSFPDYRSLAKDLKKRFVFMGEMNAWYFLFRVGESVPEFKTWVTTVPGDHPRMAEMVEKTRGQ